jgi:hypothetical protein
MTSIFDDEPAANLAEVVFGLLPPEPMDPTGPEVQKAWRVRTRPLRLRATYNRYDGVMHMLAALDLATGKILYRIRPQRHGEFLGLLKVLRAPWPGEKLTACTLWPPTT